MDIKKLNKAAKIFEQIGRIDKEIAEINRMALIVANGEAAVSFDMIVISQLTEQERRNKKAEEIENMDSIMKSMYLWGVSPCSNHKDSNEKMDKMNSPLSENAALQIFGVLLYEKQAKRQGLINRLEEMGVAIN